MITPQLASQIFETPSFCMGNHARALAKAIKSFSALISNTEIPKDGLTSSYYVECLKALYPQRKDMFTDDAGIAHIHLFGPVGLELSDIERAFGCTDYLQLREDFEFAAKNAKGVLLYGWSPGGGVRGSLETAEIIAETAKKIPVYSFSEIGFYSAGYMLTCPSSMCWGTKTGAYGNIGVIIDFWDTFEYWAQDGLYADPITNEGADLKDTFFKPKLTEEHREFLQNGINRDAAMFQNWVLKFRKLTDQEDTFRGGWFDGTEAIRRGLLDVTGAFEDVYDSLLGAIN